MNQLALLVAMTATSGLFGRPAATTCSGGSCGSAAYYNPYSYTQPNYAYQYRPAPQTYSSYYYAPQQPQAAPAAAPAAQPQPAQGLRSVPATAPATATVAQPQPAAAPAQPQPAAAVAPPVQAAPAPVYYYYYPAASPCAGGNCYRR